MLGRYVTDNAARLSLGTVSRIQSTHDMPLALLAMLDNPPWERRRDGVLEARAAQALAVLRRVQG